ncbi:MAG: hypothetical protein JWP36_1580 [Paucimonas sp.]|nr:hypothetical protein [Paucimonas sp.]
MVGTLYEYFYADAQCTQYKWFDKTRMSATYKGAVTAPAGARPGGAADVFDVVFHEGASIPAGRYAFGLYPSTRAVRIGQGNWFEGGYVDAITWDSK